MNKEINNQITEENAKIQQSEKKRFVDLSGLPTMKDSGKAGKGIDWKSVNGMKAPFQYDDISGFIEFGEYDTSRSAILCKYNGNEKFAKVNKLATGGIASVVGKINRDYRYNIGDIITSEKTGSVIEIIGREIKMYGNNGKRRKHYKYRCLKDGYVGEMVGTMLAQGCGCAICGNYAFSEDINSVYVTHKHLVELFVDKEESKKYSASNTERVWLKCPDCKNERLMSIRQLTGHGFNCPKCGDGKSYPNRFVYNVIRSIFDGVIETEKSFHWSNGKIYDIYIPSLNMIIENHGGQHYFESYKQFGRTLKDEQANDLYKHSLAIENGISNYMVLDCRQSNMNHIKNSIIESGLLEYFECCYVDWIECHKNSCRSDVIRICELWERGLSVKEISQVESMHNGTVTEYLKKGASAGLCTYTEKEARLRGNLLRVESGMYLMEVFKDGVSLGIFNSAREVEEESIDKFGVLLKHKGISRSISSNKPYKGYTFKYINNKKESA